MSVEDLTRHPDNPTMPPQPSRDQTCYEKARSRGQRTFTLVEQDEMAAAVIGEWVRLGIINGVPRKKLHDALDDACDMRDSVVTKKVPD